MKKSLLFSLSVLGAAIALSSCGGNKGGGPASEISVTTPSPMEAVHTKADYPVSVTSDGSWSAAAAPGWLTVTPVSGKGSATVTVTAAVNNGATRTGTVTFTGADGVQATLQVLQQPGEANSYIVAPGGHVLVPISRANAGGVTRIADADAVTVEFLWGDYAGQGPAGIVNTLAVEGTGSDRCIRVTAGSTEGNAVIAAKVGGVVKWSWHIWVTSFDPVATAQKYSGGDWAAGKQYANKVIMDRNLGALSATPSTANTRTIGLLYQWGRKDPFPGHFQSWANTTAEPQIYNAAGVADYRIIKADVSALNNLENAIANPMTFYSAPADPYDWYTTDVMRQNAILWGNGAAKSAYDPCPPGWKVPSYTAFQDFHAGTYSSATGTDTRAWKNDAANGYQSVYQSLADAQAGTNGLNGPGCYYSPTAKTTQDWNYGVYLPAVGVRLGSVGGLLAYMGSTGIYWGSVPFPPGVTGSTSALSFRFDSNYPYYAMGYYRAYGCSVRCIQE